MYVGGTHPDAPEWLYVTVVRADSSVRGYVQNFRVNHALPEPLAELYQIQPGDQAQVLAHARFGASVRDGLDLRFYENVLLYVNETRAARGAMTGSAQTGVGNDIGLVAGKRLWLVSPEYALSLIDVVPHGSITGGAVAGVRRVGGHLRDLLASVDEAPQHLAEILGEYLQVIEQHRVEILAMISAFLAAELISADLAATGAGAPVAALIQLVLAYLGLRGVMQSVFEATSHGLHWMMTAWGADGDPAQIGEASRDLVRMLAAIVMAIVAFRGFRNNMTNTLDLATTAAPTLVPALATGVSGGAGAGGLAQVGGGVGSIGATANLITNHNDASTSSGGGGDPPRTVQDIEPIAEEAEDGLGTAAGDCSRRATTILDRLRAARVGDRFRLTIDPEASGAQVDVLHADGSVEQAPYHVVAGVRIDGVDDAVARGEVEDAVGNAGVEHEHREAVDRLRLQTRSVNVH